MDLTLTEAERKRLAEPVGDADEPPAAVPVRVVELEPKESPSSDDCELALWSERVHVAGTPIWTQSPEVPAWFDCGREMVFAAAMTSTDEFGFEVTVNNISGHQYHFACDACRTITVLPQYT